MTVLILKVLGLAGALVLAGWLYWLTAKVLLLLTYAEQLFGMAAQLLGAVPGKSAAPTVADVDEEPLPRYQQLRRLADLRDKLLALVTPNPLDDNLRAEEVAEEVVEDVELARWADDGGACHPEAAVVGPPAALGPATRPAQLVVLELAGVDPAAAAATGTEPELELDDVDRKLARFTYAEGHNR